MDGRLIRGRVAVVAAATLWAVSVTPGGVAAAGPAGSMTGQAAQRAALTAHHQAATRLQKEVRSHVPTGHRARPARVSPLGASGTTLCVGAGAGCYPTIQAALDAARDGDTIRVGAGTFAGGITITKSVRLLGNGAASTVIRGGGSVITIGEYGAAVEPTVVISGVTVTGGNATSSPESVPFVGQDGVIALGGGVEIPPNADFSGGADVTIANSLITDNRVAATQTVPSGLATCPGGSCPFALAAGGGIDSWGNLTLTDTTVSHNRVGAASGPTSVASDAEAGGIRSWLGALSLVRTSVDDNVVVAAGPDGRYADGGGVFLEGGGAISMMGSSVSRNSASLAASLPDSVDMLAVAGGLHIGEGVAATIRNSRFVGNAVGMTNSVGYASSFSGGLHTDVDITASGVVISGNAVTVSSSEYAGGDSGAGEIGAAFSGAVISGNSVTATSTGGWAIAAAGASIYRGSISGSVLSGNRATASSSTGVFVIGGALVGDVGGISLASSTVSRNVATGHGPTGSVQGGGIFDAVTAGPPGGPLDLSQSSVTWNTASGSAGVTVQGGGIFTDNVVTSTNSVVAHNLPDQCVGC